jgi:hypothetical protein
MVVTRISGSSVRGKLDARISPDGPVILFLVQTTRRVDPSILTPLVRKQRWRTILGGETV